uniref:Ammonium transporter AmtB-like domain-containing protein n=1 Tax=Glossina palpalis gambiensis TaxID=67801 RepID=A0A1B0BAR9_9MUSC
MCIVYLVWSICLSMLSSSWNAHLQHFDYGIDLYIFIRCGVTFNLCFEFVFMNSTRNPQVSVLLIRCSCFENSFLFRVAGCCNYLLPALSIFSHSSDAFQLKLFNILFAHITGGFISLIYWSV